MLAIIGDGLIDLSLTCSQTEIAGPILLALTATKVGSAFETITIVISEYLSDRLSPRAVVMDKEVPPPITPAHIVLLISSSIHLHTTVGIVLSISVLGILGVPYGPSAHSHPACVTNPTAIPALLRLLQPRRTQRWLRTITYIGAADNTCLRRLGHRLAQGMAESQSGGTMR